MTKAKKMEWRMGRSGSIMLLRSGESRSLYKERARLEPTCKGRYCSNQRRKTDAWLFLMPNEETDASLKA